MMSTAGQVIDERYHLQAFIGRGGMGEVYAAYDRLLDRRVAVKLMLDPLAGDQRHLRRFEREARTAASLSHPGIVRVLDFGLHGRVAYLSMELVEGRSLREILNSEGLLPPKEATGIAVEVLSALSFAHASGVVHRDIKPGNILLSEEGQVKLTDFGIAQVAAGDDLTEPGAVVGTYTYLAPERAAGGRATPTSDLYSVGCVLYEMLTGEPPFVADTPVALALKHMNEAPRPLSEARPGLPARLNRLVDPALAKEPAERYPDAAAFSAALARETAWGEAPETVHFAQGEEATAIRPRLTRRGDTVALVRPAPQGGGQDERARPHQSGSARGRIRNSQQAVAAAVLLLALVVAVTTAWAYNSFGEGSSLPERPTSATERSGSPETTAPGAAPPVLEATGVDQAEDAAPRTRENAGGQGHGPGAKVGPGKGGAEAEDSSKGKQERKLEQPKPDKGSGKGSEAAKGK